jgi:hypothetical protein
VIAGVLVLPLVAARAGGTVVRGWQGYGLDEQAKQHRCRLHEIETDLGLPSQHQRSNVTTTPPAFAGGLSLCPGVRRAPSNDRIAGRSARINQIESVGWCAGSATGVQVPRVARPLTPRLVPRSSQTA